MARLNLGKVLVTLEGEHDSSRSYDKYCEVTSGGSSYVSKKAVPIGTPITDTAFWQLRASKGADGTDGTNGNDGLDAYQPFKGWYSSTSELNTSFGTPQVGDYAYIKGATANDPVAIYQCTTAGTWTDSGRTFNPSNNQEFASGESLNNVRIVNNLNGGSTNVLSAEQGKVLDQKVAALGPEISDEITGFTLYDYSVLASGKFGTSTTYKHTAVAVNVGEKYILVGNGSATYRYAFATSESFSSGGDIPLVSNSSVVEVSGGGTKDNIVIPLGCTHLVFSAGDYYGTRLFKRGKLASMGETVTKIEKEVRDIKGSVVEYGSDNTLESIYEGKQIQVASTKVGYSLSSLYKGTASNFRNKRIDVSGVDKIEWWAYASSSNYGSFFLDANDIVVKTETTQTAGIKSRTIPTNAKWFIWEYSIAHGTIYCKLIVEQKFSLDSSNVVDSKSGKSISQVIDEVDKKASIKLEGISATATSITPTWADGKYVRATDGEVIDTSSACVAVIPCANVDKMAFNGINTAPSSGFTSGYAFYDENDDVIASHGWDTSASAAIPKDYIVAVPTGAITFRVTSWTEGANLPLKGDFYCYAVTGKTVMDDIKGRLENKVDVRAMQKGWGTIIDVPFEQGHFKNDGTEGSSGAEVYSLRVRTGFLPSNFELITCARTLTMNFLKYNLDGTFVGYENGWAQEIVIGDFDFTNYKYRMVIKRIPEWSVTPSMAEEGVFFLANKISSTNNGSNSPYFKKLDFGVPPTEPYFGLQSDYSFGKAGTQTAAILEKYNELVDGVFITKQSIGTASDGSTMYVYKTNPTSPQNTNGTTARQIPYRPLKMIIVCGQHGFEKSSNYATYYFLKDLVENYMQSPLLRYIRNTLQLIIIPCANPYGIDQSIYKNANQVNLNRNWPVENWTQDITDPSDSKYPGASAGDQPEVANIVSVIQDNLDAFFAIDFHTQGQGIVDSKANINWLSMKSVEDDYMSDKWLQACMQHLKNISTLLNATYPNEVGGVVTDACGKMDNSYSKSSTGFLDAYYWEQGIMGCTFEGNNGLQ